MVVRKLPARQGSVFTLGLSTVRWEFSAMLKPIFHCDAKPLALGPGVGLDPQRHTFASPNAKICITPDAKPKISVTPDASQWNIGRVGPSGVGHVHFRLFVSISFAFRSQHKRSFQWNMGFRLLKTLQSITGVCS